MRTKSTHWLRAVGAGAGLTVGLLTAGNAGAVDLTTYGFGNARLGAAPGHVALSPSNVGGLHTAWVRYLGGAIDGQPLVVNGVGRHHRNLVLVGTGHGKVAAINVGSGRVLWSRRLGHHSISPSCQASPDGYFGVTETMVIDKKALRLYAVDANGKAWALNLLTGKTVHGWPVRAFPSSDFDWGGLALNDGRLYVPVASLCDRGYYFGGVRAIDVAHPHHIARWVTIDHAKHVFGGGVWGWGGESIDAATNNVYIATGNALPLSREDAGNSDRVVELGPLLKFIARNNPLRPPYPISDRDYGTAPTLINARGCRPKLVAMDKVGWLWVYNRYDIKAGPKQAIHIANTTGNQIPLYGMVAYDPGSRMMVLTTPTAPPGAAWSPGLIAFHLDRGCRFDFAWQASYFDPPWAGSSPMIAGGVVYIGSGRNGVVRAYRLSDGSQLWSAGTGSTIFATPSIDNKTLFVGDWRGRLWAYRP